MSFGKERIASGWKAANGATGSDGIGNLAAFAAYGLWGFLPLFWKSLSAVEPLQILCHRIVWAAMFTLILLAIKGKLAAFSLRMGDWRRLSMAALASVFITMNWGIYIWAVNSGHVTESSLGYYINPLVSVALGALFLKERLDRFTVSAVAIALMGLAAAAAMMGRIPWIALILAFSFGFYGLVKKKAKLDPLEGLAAETLIAAPFALAFIVFRHQTGAGAFGNGKALDTAFLALSGAITAIPLLLFAVATNRITLTRLGFIQYLSPTIQLVLGYFVFGERLKAPMIVAFGAVILAVAIYASSRRRFSPRT